MWRREPRLSRFARRSERSARANDFGLCAHGSQCMPLAEHAAFDFEIVLCQHHAAVETGKASRVILPFYPAGTTGARSLGVLPLYASVTAMTHGAILLMIVLLAVRVVLVNVEVCGREWFLAGFAHEAGLVPSASQAPICCLY